MFLHLGQDVIVRKSEILGIFDLDNTSYSNHSRNFLKEAEKQGEVVTITDDLPKSFVLTEEFGMNRVYLTQLGSAALEKRLK